ncbi:hypothetical protein MKW92_024592 [Papaver armeniacum]|nr:hypothetical protein MKW92_024592 [Papaver armeniacum]
MAVVVLDALTRRQWVGEEDLTKDLKLHNKQLRQILRFFRKRSLWQDGKEGKVHTHSYRCLDYSQIHDVVRYKHQHMKKKLKLDYRNTVQEYLCAGCTRQYNALDALHLISSTGEGFHCENCNGKLMKQQLKPLVEQLKNAKDLTCPEFGTLQAWEARAFMGDPKVEVELSDVAVKEEDIKPEVGAMKLLGPWMIMQGMNLTEEQRGQVTTGEKVDGNPTFEEKKDIQVEYYKAYYEALMKIQQERNEAAKINQQEPTSSENGFSDMPSDRQVGMKSKREEDDYDVEWEDG